MAPNVVSDVDDLKRLCAPVFDDADCQNIQWVGVFGSYARGEQHAGSDVDLIVGFKDRASWDDVYKTAYHVKKTLPPILERDVDALYMRNMEIRGYVMLQALLSAKTIYEAGPWLYKNQTFARKFLADGHHKLKTALHLETKIQKQLASIKGQESVVRFYVSLNC